MTVLTSPALQTIRRAFLLATLLVSAALAQQPPAPPSASITGVITDPSGAVIMDATVTLHRTAASLPDIVVDTHLTGHYTIVASPGVSSVLVVTAPGFATFTSNPLRLVFEKPRTLDVRLKIASAAEQVNVNDSTGLDTDPSRNGDSLTLTGKAIDALPLDSSELLLELQGLSGGATPDLYVDGFSGQSLPPRDTIREIRINQNPYSALNDTNPGAGRIEIFTKPGTSHFHGDVYATGNDNALNTSDPFVGSQPPYHSSNVAGNLNGPIGKHVSYDAELGRQSFQSNAPIVATALDANNNLVAVNQAVPAPTVSVNFSPRFDFALGRKNTLTFRYGYNSSTQTNGGIGQLALATQGYTNHNTAQTFRVSNSFMVSAKIVNDTRFVYTRSRVTQTPNLVAPTLSVAGAFTGGGNSGGSYNDNQDRYELQNYVSQSAGKHFFTYGGRFRATRDANHSTANYQGTYTFASLALNPTCTPLDTCSSYQTTQQGIAAGLTAAQIRASGGGASQFSITQGNPNVAVLVTDEAFFFQDDWKLKPTITLSTGLRFETQNHIADHADYAPRLGIAWSLKTRKAKPPLYVVRGGAGLFYARFTSGYVLQAERQNGITQQQYLITTPNCFPNCDTPYNLNGALSQSTIYQVSPTFHAPYYFSGAASIERQVNTWGTVTLSYLFGRGIHDQLTRNINAPLPGTYNPAVPTSGTRPLGGNQNIYEYDSQGLDRTHRINANFFLRFKGGKYLVYGFYQFRHNTADYTGGFASNQYDIRADEGRSNTDLHHSAYVGASTHLPLGIESFVFMRTQSGAPFDITVGQDLNGDSIFNDRPAFATDLTRASVVRTQYGNFDTSPIAGQTIIPHNYGSGPGLFVINMTFNREFTFGPAIKPPAGSPAPRLAPGQKPHIDRRFSIDFALDAQNVFNQVNLANPVGTLNSPLFGRSIALSTGNTSNNANRTIQLETYFHF